MPQRESSTPRPPASDPGRTPRIRPTRTRVLLLTALTAPVLAAPFVLSSTGGPDRAAAALAASEVAPVDPVALAERELRASRSNAARLLPAVTLRPRPTDHDWATAPLNVWEQPGERGKRFGVLEDGAKVALTGETSGRWAEALVKGKARWVNSTYLAEKKPVVRSAASGGAATGGISTAPCPDGSSTESGLTSNAVMMFRAICAAFPELTTYGGYDGHGEHADGRAVDFMTYSNSALGNAIAEWARANAAALNIRTIIWAQKIWTTERSGEGWRYMSDRGSTTANHYDHPHISVH